MAGSTTQQQQKVDAATTAVSIKEMVAATAAGREIVKCDSEREEVSCVIALQVTVIVQCTGVTEAGIVRKNPDSS